MLGGCSSLATRVTPSCAEAPRQANCADGRAPAERCLSAAGLGWQARWFRQQRGVVRFNCADSLDRTNVASFYGALQVGRQGEGAGQWGDDGAVARQ